VIRIREERGGREDLAPHDREVNLGLGEMSRPASVDLRALRRPRSADHRVFEASSYIYGSHGCDRNAALLSRRCRTRTVYGWNRPSGRQGATSHKMTGRSERSKPEGFWRSISRTMRESWSTMDAYGRSFVWVFAGSGLVAFVVVVFSFRRLPLPVIVVAGVAVQMVLFQLLAVRHRRKRRADKETDEEA